MARRSDPVERYVCRIVNRRSGSDVECGSGIIAALSPALWGKLLKAPSCFGEKYSLSLESGDFYVLLTAHSNLYQESGEKEQPLKAHLDAEDYHLVLGSSEIPLRDCVASSSTSSGTGERYIAVSCCGIDSILVLCKYAEVRLDYSLKSHSSADKCSIAYNFAFLLLRADVVNKKVSNFSPPVLGSEADVGAHNERMLWCSAPQKVPEIPLTLATDATQEAGVGSPSVGSLQQSMCQIREKRSFKVNLPQEAANDANVLQCYIGAPIVQDGAGTTKSIVGIYVGEGRVTSLQGIFGILKGDSEAILLYSPLILSSLPKYTPLPMYRITHQFLLHKGFFPTQCI